MTTPRGSAVVPEVKTISHDVVAGERRRRDRHVGAHGDSFAQSFQME